MPSRLLRPLAASLVFALAVAGLLAAGRGQVDAVRTASSDDAAAITALVGRTADAVTRRHEQGPERALWLAVLVAAATAIAAGGAGEAVRRRHGVEIDMPTARLPRRRAPPALARPHLIG